MMGLYFGFYEVVFSNVEQMNVNRNIGLVGRMYWFFAFIVYFLVLFTGYKGVL